MAAQGFNICIVGRNADKIAQVLKDISVKYPKIKTRAVICDFAKLFTVQEYQTIVADKVADIDIAMLFLNAGVMPEGAIGELYKMNNDDLQAVVTVNALHPIYLAKVLINQILARNHLSAIVITSSGLG